MFRKEEFLSRDRTDSGSSCFVDLRGRPGACSCESGDIHSSEQKHPAIRFRDVTESTGITFVLGSGENPEKPYPIANGSGVAILDYDGDGWLDLYFATTRNLPLSAPNRSRGNRLYRNRGDGTFEDVTDRAGVGFRGFCHGLAAGDINNDGFPDLFLTNLGPNVLYMNNGDGTFRHATPGSGLDRPLRSSGAAMLDYDNDGQLDLYVSCYGQWTYDGYHYEREQCNETTHQDWVRGITRSSDRDLSGTGDDARPG